MKTNRILWMALTAALLLATPFIARSAQPLVPTAINYQGHLTDTLGNPVSSGYYEIEFRIWDDASSTNAGSLIWGRTYALHVVDGGLFNILLNDGGAMVQSPTTPTNSLLYAFAGPDRYLGLTIANSNNVAINANSQVEISPRQQLASAPFAMQAQTANMVTSGGVSSNSLADGSVIPGKIAANAVNTLQITNGAVTTAKIGDGQVTTAKIADSAVTSPKLNINGDFHLNNHTIYLRTASDTNHGLTWTNLFGGQSMDGPVLFGYGAGALGTTYGGEEKAALVWDHNQAVTLQGAVSITNGPVSMFGPMSTNLTMGVTYTASTDGFIIFFGYSGFVQVTIMDSGGGTIFNKGAFYNTAGADGIFITFPVAKGEKWKIQSTNENPTGNYDYYLAWRPLGIGQM